MRTSSAWRSIPRTSPSRPSMRSGPTGPASAAGSRCRPAPPSTRPIPRPGSFPTGTRFWKEFSFGGRRVETRYIERLPDGDGSTPPTNGARTAATASLAPERGRGGAYAFGGGRSHTIPAASDCRVCHESRPHAGARLQPAPALARPRPRRAACRAGTGRGSRPRRPRPGRAPRRAAGAAAARAPPRIAAATPVERAALGYLHANCGHCHNGDGPLAEPRARSSATGPAPTGRPRSRRRSASRSASRRPGQSPDAVLRIEPGQPERSALAQRMGSRWAALQMPPLGTNLVDEQALELVRQWIAGMDGTLGADQEERDGENDAYPYDASGRGRAAAAAGRGPGAGRPGEGSASTWWPPPGATTATPPGSWVRTGRSRT